MWSISFRLSYQNLVCLFSPVNAACLASLIPIDFIVLTTFGEVKIMKLLIM